MEALTDLIEVVLVLEPSLTWPTPVHSPVVALVHVASCSLLRGKSEVARLTFECGSPVILLSLVIEQMLFIHISVIAHIAVVILLPMAYCAHVLHGSQGMDEPSTARLAVRAHGC